jgi:hypothetical protein
MTRDLLRRLTARDRPTGRDAGARRGFWKHSPHGPGGVTLRVWPGLKPRPADAAGLARARQRAADAGATPPPARIIRDGLGLHLSRAEYVPAGGAS